MGQAKHEIKTLSGLISSADFVDTQKEMILTTFLQTNDTFSSIGLFSEDGRTVFSAKRNENDTPCPNIRNSEETVSGENIISDMIYSGKNCPSVHITADIARTDSVSETLCVELSLMPVLDGLKGLNIGTSGQIHIMDISGNYISLEDISRVDKKTPHDREAIQKKLNGSETIAEWVDNTGNTSMHYLCARIPDTGWIVVLCRPVSALYAHIYQNIKWTLFITLLILAITTFLGWNWINHLLEPIHILHRQVKLLGQGDLDHTIYLKSRDEIGDLGIAFNEMKNSLKDYINREIEMATKLAHSKNLAVLGTAYSKMTHEVGNLMNNISIALSAFKMESLSPKGANILDILEKESMRVRGFIHNFLLFAKKPEAHLKKRRLDLILKQVIDIFREETEHKSISVELSLPTDLPYVNIDDSLIYLAINNIIKNSIDAMTNTGGSLYINVNVIGIFLLIDISDTGPGVGPDMVNKIFDPFFTTKGKQGTGLGLAIAKNAVEAHHGTIECMSQINKGTSFIIRLPINLLYGENT